jgi:hypothetical protein
MAVRAAGFDISEAFLGKGTAGRALRLFFKVEGLLPVMEGNRSFYAPGFVF